MFHQRLPLAVRASVPQPPDIPVLCSPPTACTQLLCCPVAGCVSQSSFYSGRCSVECAVALCGRAWLRADAGGRRRSRRSHNGWVKRSKVTLGVNSEREMSKCGLYTLSSALLTLARRQPHHRAERGTLARPWPIPKDVQRGEEGLWGGLWWTGAVREKKDKRLVEVFHIIFWQDR